MTKGTLERIEEQILKQILRRMVVNENRKYLYIPVFSTVSEKSLRDSVRRSDCQKSTRIFILEECAIAFPSTKMVRKRREMRERVRRKRV